MPVPEKTKRNRELYAYYKKGIPYRKLGAMYGIKHLTAYKIVKRMKESELASNQSVKC